MSESPNSTLNSHPKATEATETTADLSQNLDEILDLELGLGAIGGLRHSASCEAAERSQRRYDNRNHRLHESRMEKLGLQGGGESDEPEDEDMSQQVLIRSPVTHHHHYEQPAEPTPEPAAPAPEPAAQPKGMSTTAKVATSLAAAALLGPGGVGMAAMLGAFDKPPAPVVAPVDTDTDTIPTVIIKPHAE